MSSQTIQRFDLEGARSWMSGICGPHRLATATPERLRFHHSANMFKSRATTLGVIEYGTDVTIDIEDAEHFSSYSLTLPLGLSLTTMMSPPSLAVLFHEPWRAMKMTLR